jgi:lysophospholipase L1-like esterase
MMATSGAALVAEGADAIPPEVVAAGDIAAVVVPELAVVELLAEAIVAPDKADVVARVDEPIVGVFLEGESTSDPAGGWNRYPRDVAAGLGERVAVVAEGVNGATINQVLSEGSKSQYLSGTDGLNVAVLWIGINDTSNGGEPVETYAGIQTWVGERRSEGWDRVVLVTVPKFKIAASASSDAWGSHEMADATRRSLNDMIVANAAGVDAIVDLRGVPGIGDDYSVDDQQWRPDRVHFTEAGYAAVAVYVTETLRSLGS